MPTTIYKEELEWVLIMFVLHGLLTAILLRLYQINLIPIYRCGSQTAPFCINISNNAKDENISVRSRAIHSASFL